MTASSTWFKTTAAPPCPGLPAPESPDLQPLDLVEEQGAPPPAEGGLFPGDFDVPQFEVLRLPEDQRVDGLVVSRFRVVPDEDLHVVHGDPVEPALRVTVADARAPAAGDDVADENVPDDARPAGRPPS